VTRESPSRVPSSVEASPGIADRGDSGLARMVVSFALCDDFYVAVTVLIVDDHAAFRASARKLLELDGFDVVGEAADGAGALELVDRLKPELVLLDVALPDLSGFEVAERLAPGRSKIVLTSSRAQRDLGRRVERSGALGFIPKDELSGEGLDRLLQGAAEAT
jgi:DNA-binding NarL/FixJ family response regulator